MTETQKNVLFFFAVLVLITLLDRFSNHPKAVVVADNGLHGVKATASASHDREDLTFRCLDPDGCEVLVSAPYWLAFTIFK